MMETPHNGNQPEGSTMNVFGNSCAGHLNIAYLLEIAGGNESFVPDVLIMFREESKDFVSRLWNHFEHKDFYSLKKAAHAMKPTGSYIGVEGLTILITSLEKAAPSGDTKEVNSIIIEIERSLNRLNEEIDVYLSSFR